MFLGGKKLKELSKYILNVYNGVNHVVMLGLHDHQRANLLY